MATKKRRYHLKKRDGNGNIIGERIVLATSQQQAIFHAAVTEYSVEPLSVENAIRLTAEGVAEETAGEVPSASNSNQIPMPGLDGGDGS